MAVGYSETSWSASRLSHLRFDLVAGAFHTVEVYRVSIAAYHAIEWHVVEATCAFSHLVGHLCSL
jgi:hypothetical protein